MPDAVAGGHDRFPGRVGKGFKGRFDDFRTMAFIELPGMLVQDIGAKIERFFRVGDVVGYKLDGLAGVFFKPDSGERLQNIPPDAVQSADGNKARLLGVNGQPCYLIGGVAGAGKVCLNLFPWPGMDPGEAQTKPL